MMSEQLERDASAESDSKSRSSPPVLPPDSPGSSVSTRLQEEYTELLRYAVGGTGPGPDLQGTQGSDRADRAFQPISKSGGSSARHTPADLQQDDVEAPVSQPWKVFSDDTDRDVNSNSIYPSQIPSFAAPSQSKEQEQRSEQNDTSDNRCDRDATEHYTIIDPIVTEMGHKLDCWLGNLKCDILAEFGRSSIQTLEAQRKAHQMETKEILCDKQRLEREVNRLCELVNTLQQGIERKDTLIENLTQALSKQKGKVTMAQAFYNCKAEMADGKRRKFTEKVAVNHHERQLQERVLKAWFGLIQSRWRKRIEKICQDQAQGVCLTLTTDYEDKIKSLNSHIEILEEKIQCLQQEREQYAEQVKKAFMRGVCALNMEAMSAFADENQDSNASNRASQANGGSDNFFPGNMNNNLESSMPYKEDQPPKSLPADLVISAIPSTFSARDHHHHSMSGVGGGHTHKTKTATKSTKGKTRPSTAPSHSSSRPNMKGVSLQGVPLAPPMASVVVERHNPVTKQTLGKATASRYPKPHPSDGPGTHSKHSAAGVPTMSRSHPTSLIGQQTYKPLAGQSLTTSPSIKVVD